MQLHFYVPYFQTETPFYGRSAEGYGAKVLTSYMVKIGKRKYRVYCTIFSNCGTCYILQKRKKYIINESDIDGYLLMYFGD